jgi:hypothetical protein
MQVAAKQRKNRIVPIAPSKTAPVRNAISVVRMGSVKRDKLLKH